MMSNLETSWRDKLPKPQTVTSQRFWIWRHLGIYGLPRWPSDISAVGSRNRAPGGGQGTSLLSIFMQKKGKKLRI